MTALTSLLNRLIRPASSYAESPGWFFPVIALLSGVISLLWERIRRHKAADTVVAAELTAFGGTVKLRLLCDSGNRLSEPISGKPVMIVDREALRPILPLEEFPETDPDPEAIRRWKLRMIPSSSIGGDRLLLGFLPQKLTVNGRPVDAAAAIGGPFGEKDSGIDGILPAALFDAP